MVVPVVLAMPMVTEDQGHHHAMAMSVISPAGVLLATLLHAIGYLLVTTIIAVVVFEKLGVGMLRKAWLNLDLLWAVTLIGTGLLSAIL
jgi:energy-converting hydrogenase Eha subunit A